MVALHTFTGRTVGATVGADEFPAGLVGTAAPVYGTVAGDVVVDFTGIAAGANGMVRDNGTATRYAQWTAIFSVTGPPAAATELLQIRSAAAKIGSALLGAGASCTVLPRGGSDATLTGADSTGAITLPVWTTAVALSTAETYMLQVRFDAGTTTANGRMHAVLTRVSDSVVLAEGARENLNNTAVAVSHHQSGKTATTNVSVVRIHSLAWDSVAYALLDAAGDPPVPVVTQGVAAWVDLRTSTVTGTATYACTDTAGLTVTQPTPGLFHVTQADAAATLTLEVTDDVGTSTTTASVPARGWDTGLRVRYWDGTALV